MSKDLQADLTADLVADLGRPSALPASVRLPPLPALETTAGTPAVALTLTPLRWSRPAMTSASGGTGLSLRLGPWRVEVRL